MSEAKKESALKATFKQTVSGGVGGMSLVLAGHPLDTLKYRERTALHSTLTLHHHS